MFSQLKTVIMKKIILVLSLGMLCAGCGVKPKQVDAPAGTDPAHFPKPYPARNIR